MDKVETVQVPPGTIQKWQEIVDLLAEILRVPSALIMKVEPPNIRVLVRSESIGNPYHRDELASLNTGLYCETVINTRRLLLVPDALSDAEWNANPDIKMGMVSYIGVPIVWPNGAIFGTICALDGKPNGYSELFRRLLFQCRDLLQGDLKSLEATAELESKVVERTAELHSAQMELAHATRVTMLGELTASIAHEVNQPLGAISGNAEVCLLLLDDKKPNLAEARVVLRDIINDSNRAHEVIRRIRELAKKTDIQKVPIDINEVIEEVLLIFRHEALTHGVSLRRELAPALPQVLGDRIQLQQVIMNLLVNGIQATSPVTDRPHELRIRSHEHRSNEILVSVEDSGVGIKPENVDQLFSAFFTTKTDGMGIGLSICRSIIEQHGGRIWASQNSWGGSTFQFTLRASGAMSS